MTDVDATTVTHALVLRDHEAALATEGATLVLERQRSTALRGPVALATDDGSVIGIGVIGELVSATETGDANGYRWRLEAVTRLTPPRRLRPRLFGPIWLRLDGAERRSLHGETPSPLPPASSAENADDDPNRPLAEAAATADGATLPAEGPTSGASEQAAQSAALSEADPPEESQTTASAEPPAVAGTSAASPSTPAPATVLIEAASDADGDAEAPAATSPRSDDAANVDIDTDAATIDASATPQIVDHTAMLAAARARAQAYVPTQSINEDAARQLLVRLREEEIKVTFPNTPPTAGVLRKSLLERLIDEAVESEADFVRLIPREVRTATDKDQIEAYLPPIVAILARIR